MPLGGGRRREWPLGSVFAQDVVQESFLRNRNREPVRAAVGHLLAWTALSPRARAQDRAKPGRKKGAKAAAAAAAAAGTASPDISCASDSAPRGAVAAAAAADDDPHGTRATRGPKVRGRLLKSAVVVRSGKPAVAVTAKASARCGRARALNARVRRPRWFRLPRQHLILTFNRRRRGRLHRRQCPSPLRGLRPLPMGPP